ncbi:hypothetical protein [Hymenobacter wooponensis]|uniref:DUF3575 domain-containing protein n=1 Tax=Hymenobacter wooponensis TaxID=1525360 RepID=A0A4Z0MFA8_9BACT|nr:hypothetical protein [Hymenobacter wooponensis]TGD78442.1 hypothetical protein EU557_20270 [Hymenobacter wooponensis]
MRTSYLKVLLAAATTTPAVALAQSTPSGTPVEASALAQTPESPAKSTLFKIGTGLSQGFEFGGYSGLSVPIVLGVEHHLASAVSLYGNLFGGLNIIRRQDYDRPLLREIGADAGVRYYYNQEKRKQKGRDTGPFVGNYLALHSSSSLFSYRRQNSYNVRNYFSYDYSTLNLVWGMQRRIGGHGLIDAYAGAGISNPFRFSDQDRISQYKRRPTPNLELGVKISLVP